MSRSVSETLFVQQKEDQSESRANWIGYVAVATDEGGVAHARQARHIIVAWRGAVKIYTRVSQRRELRVHVRRARALRRRKGPRRGLRENTPAVVQGGSLLTFSARETQVNIN
jgi:hypothetical protein